MVLAKLKTAVAAVMVVCAVGFGVWASAGTGDGSVPAENGGAAPTDPPKGGEKQPPAKMHPDLERMQGRWRIAILSERGTTRLTDPNTGDDPAALEFEVRGDKLTWPYRQPGAGVQKAELTVVLDPAKTPKHIDLVTADGKRQLGVYEFPAGVAGAVPVELRFALSTDGKRPVGFRDPPDGVAVYGLVRVADAKKPPAKDPPAGKPSARLDEAKEELRLIQKELEALAAAKQLDPAAVDRLRKRLDAVRALLGEVGEGAGPPPGAADLLAEARARREVELQRAQVVLREAEVQLEVARAELARAHANVERASAQLDLAKAQVDALKADRAPGEKYTIRVRTLLGKEESEQRPLAADGTVLTAIVGRFKKQPTDLPPLDVWIIRPQPEKGDLTILYVDWDAIINRGNTRTNYQLLPGDTLVIQYRPKP